MKKALLYLFMYLFVTFFTQMGVLLLWEKVTGDDDSIYIVITSSAVYSVILLALFLWRRWAEVSPAWLRTRRWDILFWAAIAALGTFIPSMALEELLPELDDIFAETLKAIIDSDWGYLTLCVFAPFVEEVIFRGAILRALLHSFKKPWVAIAISAVIFSAVHGNPAQMPHAFLLGLLLGWMYASTGSILPGVMLHWVNNTVCYALVLLVPQYETMTMHQIFGSDIRVGLALLCSLCVLLPALYQLNMRMKRQP